MSNRTRVITEPQVSQDGYWRSLLLHQAGSKWLLRYGQEPYRYICIEGNYSFDGVDIFMYVPKSKNDPKGILDALAHLRAERDVTTVYVVKHPDSWVDEFKELR